MRASHARRNRCWLTLGSASASLILLAAWRFHPDPWAELSSPGPCSPVEVQHPLQNAVLPANFAPPAVLWKTNVLGVARWGVGIRAGSTRWWFEDVQPLWHPGEADWAQMKAAAAGRPIELVVAGLADRAGQRLQARSSVRFTVCSEQVLAPLFYREVNLPFIDAVKDPSRIRWRFGSITNGKRPPVVLERLPVCGNCHSFSQNGGYLAMDVDYANNKGSYVIAKTSPQMHLATSDIITWDDFHKQEGPPTFGLLSQISPDGRYVLSTVKDRSVFVPRPDLAFSQLFFPFQGIIAIYDRQTKRFSPLAGADDAAFVQSNPVWSPDGQRILFARCRAADWKGRTDSTVLSPKDCAEFLNANQPFQFDLYEVPFNGGTGGAAQPLRGASRNGRSNFFPKYSPDGRWIVFCQAANYMLLQPDSELFIVSAEGGEARRLGCNLGRMNSWHTWSPDGQWLVFSSKAHSDYTQLYLSRFVASGDASPPVWLDQLLDPDRAANIPEFVNLPIDGICRIAESFLDDYSFFRAGDELLKAGDVDRALEKYRAALSLNPANAKAHERLGFLLHHARGRSDEGLDHLRAAVRLEPHAPSALFALGTALMDQADYTNALRQLTAAEACLSPGASYEISDSTHDLPESLQYELGLVNSRLGDAAEAKRHYEAALRLEPRYPEVHNNLGNLLLRSGQIGEAEGHFLQALRIAPNHAQAHNNLGLVRQKQNRRPEAVACFEKAIASEPAYWQAHFNLANAHQAAGRWEQAVTEFRETLRLQPSFVPAQRALARLEANH